MSDIYQSLKNIILSKDYELRDILYKINLMYLEGEITETQKQELDDLAREYANPENSYAPLQKQIDNIDTQIDRINAEIREIKGEEEPEEPTEEYPEYKQPTGAHDAYKIGDKITYKGKKYICKIDKLCLESRRISNILGRSCGGKIKWKL